MKIRFLMKKGIHMQLLVLTSAKLKKKKEMWVENQKKSYLKTDGSTKQLKSV